MSEQSELYRHSEILRLLKAFQEQETAKPAECHSRLKTHPGYQAILKDPEWVSLEAKWREAVEMDKQKRAFLNGRFWEDLSETEQARIEELNDELHCKLFPLMQAIVKLREDYGIPSAFEDEQQHLRTSPADSGTQGERNGNTNEAEKKKMGQITMYEKVKNWALNNPVVVSVIVLIILFSTCVAVITNLKTILDWFGIVRLK